MRQRPEAGLFATDAITRIVTTLLLDTKPTHVAPDKSIDAGAPNRMTSFSTTPFKVTVKDDARPAPINGKSSIAVVVKVNKSLTSLSHSWCRKSSSKGGGVSINLSQ